MPLRFLLWDGAALGPPPSAAAATVVIRNRSALLGLLFDAEMAFGDGYACGAIEVQGDLLAAVDAAYQVFPCRPLGEERFERRPPAMFAWSDVHHHYDVGNDFYRMWLDDAMVYTCAYFADPAATLAQAQRAKLEYVCQKLRLRPGERVIEAGCGWGALALHMAARHGVGVKAYNISHEQIVYARAEAHRLGLADRVEFIEDDFRNVWGSCDAFVSLGMVEHVGAAHFGELGTVINRVLDEKTGRALLHFIGRNAPRELSAWIRRRIFPGAYLPTLAEVTEAVCEPWDLSVIDAENLRLHYALTLEHWLSRFDAAAPAVSARYGEPFTRAWRLYLAGSIVGFRRGTLQLFQLSLARGSSNQVPWTRAYLYQPAGMSA
jgi:cyclopropane-fatty-acyl-phospholipid synthase